MPNGNILNSKLKHSRLNLQKINVDLKDIK